MNQSDKFTSCDLLENNYLCRINNNVTPILDIRVAVVICLKTTIFVVSTTTNKRGVTYNLTL